MTQIMAQNFFHAFQEFNAPLELYSEVNSADEQNQTKKPKDKSSIRNLFNACEKFNMPQIASTDSLASCTTSTSISTNSSCSNFDELLFDENASFPTKVYNAFEKFTRVLNPDQFRSRLPGAGAAPTAPLTFEQLGVLQKILLAFEEFVDPHLEENDQFPKFC